MKKLLSFLLSAAMLCTLGVSVFAANVPSVDPVIWSLFTEQLKKEGVEIPEEIHYVSADEMDFSYIEYDAENGISLHDASESTTPPEGHDYELIDTAYITRVNEITGKVTHIVFRTYRCKYCGHTTATNE